METFIQEMLARLTGPLRFRFVIQPLIAILLGFRDGRLDAKAGDPPYMFDLVFHGERRRELLLRAGRTVVSPVVVGIILDIIVQILLFRRIFPFQALMVGTFVIAIPYMLARGASNRFLWRRRHVYR